VVNWIPVRRVLSPVTALTLIIFSVFLIGVMGFFFLQGSFTPRGNESGRLPEEPVAVCGNGLVEEGENCLTCPEEFTREECACFEPGAEAQASLGEEFYLCEGQTVNFDDVSVSLVNTSSVPEFEFAWFDGVVTRDSVEENTVAFQRFLELEVLKEVMGGVLLTVRNHLVKAQVGEPFNLSEGDFAWLDDGKLVFSYSRPFEDSLHMSVGLEGRVFEGDAIASKPVLIGREGVLFPASTNDSLFVWDYGSSKVSGGDFSFLSWSYAVVFTLKNVTRESMNETIPEFNVSFLGVAE